MVGAARQVLADARWGQACLAYNVQIPVAGEQARAFVAAQAELAVQLPQVRLIPRECLHISLPLSAVVDVASVRLVRERVYPSLLLDVLAEYRLVIQATDRQR
jgi:hypothetical protein